MDMLQQNNTACFDKAIALSQAREQSTLIAVLLEQLQQSLAGHCIRLFDVIPGESLQLKHSGIDSAEPFDADKLAQAACKPPARHSNTSRQKPPVACVPSIRYTASGVSNIWSM